MEYFTALNVRSQDKRNYFSGFNYFHSFIMVELVVRRKFFIKGDDRLLAVFYDFACFSTQSNHT
jgi:TfoX/Sxy family transcriptional regulator of competence genes